MSTYKVKLNMSKEYMIEANDPIEAEKFARDKFGCDYYIDEVITEEVKNEVKLLSSHEFFMKWKEISNDFDERIADQLINIELPLLGIKTELPFCAPTIEGLNKLYKDLIEIEYIVNEEQCCCGGGGVWFAEVPFEYKNKPLVMVVDSENPNEWAIYKNVLSDNGKYDSVEYDELMDFTGNANDISPDFQIYYIRALQLLANR